MTTESNSPLQPKVRLQFIDLARSVAIILMLEGHFVDDSIMHMYRDLSDPIYWTWLNIRGFTAPTFLTVSGIVFVYLLIGNDQKPYFENIRVKRGYKRVMELIFWGYLLQTNSFHVLQCIGFSILGILLLYGIYKMIRFIPLWVYYLVAGLAFFGTEMFNYTLPKDHYLPENAPVFIQNILRGPRSIFPLFPWMGYPMMGAAMGVFFFKYKLELKKWIAPTIMILLGLFLSLILEYILLFFDRQLGNEMYRLASMDLVFERVGVVCIFLGLLMFFEIKMGQIGPNLFLKMGQNTLTIFVLHMFVLYGVIPHFGISQFFHYRLNAVEVTIGAILFVGFFFLIIRYIEWFEKILSFAILPIRKFTNRIFGITE
jgi:uncharacterized membrane protein